MQNLCSGAVWSGEQEGNNQLPIQTHVSSYSTQERERREHSGPSGVIVDQRSHLQGRKEAGSRLGWGDKEWVRAGLGQAPMHLPLCTQLCSSSGLITFQTPSQEPPLASCIPAGCRARGPYGGNNKTINFPLKNNICGFLGRQATAIPTQRHISHPSPHLPTS